MEPTRDQMVMAARLLAQMQNGPGQEFLTNDAFFALHARAVEVGKKFMLQDGEVKGQQFYIHGRHRETKERSFMPAILVDLPPEGKKYQAMRGLGMRFVDEMPEYMLVAIVHIGETWMAGYRNSDSPGRGPYLRKGVPTPSERPDRREAVTASTLSMDARFSATHSEIVRDKSGKVTGFGKVYDMPYDPAQASANINDNMNFLSFNILMGYLQASRPGGK